MANSVYLGFGPLSLPNGTQVTDSANGKLLVTGTTPMLQLGGTTNQSPALKGNTTGSALGVRAADDSAFASIQASGYFTSSNSTLPTLGSAAPTISSGFGTSPSVANQNGNAAFVINVGTGGTATNGVIGMPTTINGWVAACVDITAAAGHTGLQTVQTASATNSITIESQNSAGTATAWATGSLVRIVAFPF